ncbi:hypothetical protein GCM10009830_42330 [Glycomyces endophyticus]|uniref:Uncharacterized protein n=1 Tax=Glycomyces endophyticus TaxID=480996 RepID=A0ABP4TLR1_9ACTN
MGGHADGGVRRPVAGVAADALHGLEEDAGAQDGRVAVEELAAVLVAVVQEGVGAHEGEAVGRRGEARVEVVVVVGGDLQEQAGVAQPRRGGGGVVGREGDVLGVGDAGGPVAAADGGDAQGDPDAPLGVGHRQAPHEPEGGGDLGRRLGVEAEHGAVEQRRAVEVVGLLGEGHVVDALDARAGRGGGAGGGEVGAPAVLGLGAAEEHRGAAGGGDGGEVGLAGAVLAGQDRGEEPLGAAGRGGRVGALDGDGGDRGRAFGRGGPVDEDAGAPLLPQVDRFGAVLAGAGEPERGERGGDLGVRAGPGADLHERGAVEARRRGQGGAVPGGLLEAEQRPEGVDGGDARVGLAEHVVEHLQRQRPGVAGLQDGAQEPGEVEGALAGEEPVVPAPLEDVHVEAGRVGELEEEQLLGRDDADRGGVGAAGEYVEGVEAQAEVRVVGAAHDPPGPVVGRDVAAPGEGLVGEAHAVVGGALGEEAQVRGGEVVVVHGPGVDGRAHEHEVGAEPLHDGELGLGAAQVGAQEVGRDGFEVAERLVEVDAQPEVGAAGADLLGAVGGGHEVGFEDLHAVEARGGGRGELVVEGAGEADGGDAQAVHGFPPQRAAASASKWRSIRSASGSAPVNSRKESTAW